MGAHKLSTIESKIITEHTLMTYDDIDQLSTPLSTHRHSLALSLSILNYTKPNPTISQKFEYRKSVEDR